MRDVKGKGGERKGGRERGNSVDCAINRLLLSLLLFSLSPPPFAVFFSFLFFPFSFLLACLLSFCRRRPSVRPVDGWFVLLLFSLFFLFCFFSFSLSLRFSLGSLLFYFPCCCCCELSGWVGWVLGRPVGRFAERHLKSQWRRQVVECFFLFGSVTGCSLVWLLAGFACCFAGAKQAKREQK